MIIFRCVFFLLVSLVFLSTSASAQSLKDLYAAGTKSFQEGRLDEAIRLYKKAVALNPNFPQVYNMLGMAYRQKNNPEEAIRYFNLTIGLDDTFVTAYQGLCQIYYRQAQFQQAVSMCKTAVELDPDFFEGKLSLGWGYLMGLSEPVPAIDYFIAVLEEREVPMVYYGLGLAYLADDQRMKVFDCITRLKQLGLKDVAKRLEDLLRENKDYVLKKGGQLVEAMVKEEPFTYQGLSEDQLRNIQVRLKAPLE